MRQKTVKLLKHRKLQMKLDAHYLQWRQWVSVYSTSLQPYCTSDAGTEWKNESEADAWSDWHQAHRVAQLSRPWDLHSEWDFVVFPSVWKRELLKAGTLFWNSKVQVQILSIYSRQRWYLFFTSLPQSYNTSPVMCVCARMCACACRLPVLLLCQPGQHWVTGRPKQRIVLWPALTVARRRPFVFPSLTHSFNHKLKKKPNLFFSPPWTLGFCPPSPSCYRLTSDLAAGCSLPVSCWLW